MKKTIPIIVMAMLCLIFGKTNMAKAQDNKAIDVTKKGIQVGQKVPEALLNNINNYKTKTAKLSDFKGKLVILDFWATWCSPCIAMIPKMEALQAQFKDQIQILTVTYQTDKEVLPFLEKLQKGKPSNLPEITDDQELHKLFPHIYLPHYIWIDKEGTVKAITGYEELTAENITKTLTASINVLKQKLDLTLPYDRTKPFLINGNGGDGTNLIYHSVFTGYTEGMKARMSVYPATAPQSRVVLTNTTVSWFFRLAYADGGTKFYNKSSVRIQIADTTRLIPPPNPADFHQWSKNGNSFCYELSMPAVPRADFYRIMREDLTRMFPQYRAEVKHMKVKSMVLVRTSNSEKLKTTDPKKKAVIEATPFGIRMRNSTLSQFILRLQILYQQHSKLPIIDGTGFKDKIDMDLEARLTDFQDLNSALAAYDLKFVEKEDESDMLFITDRINEGQKK